MTRLLAVFALICAASAEWRRVPVVSDAIRAQGYEGGEGCQELRDIRVSSSNASFMIFGTDVGGIYRSLDGGRNWSVCMVGWNSRGGASFAIDPVNDSNVIGLGGNSEGVSVANGLYISNNRAASWKQTLTLHYPKATLLGAAIVIDPRSYNTSTGRCMRIFFSSPAGLYLSNDGGESWTLVNTRGAGCILALDPATSHLLIGCNTTNETGLLLTTDSGVTLKQLNDWQVVGLDAHVQSGRVYLSTRGYVGFTEDLGMSWQQAGSNISRVELQRITVSPADPDYMTVWHVAANWNWKYLHTSDGGTTWADGVYDNSLSFMPYNVRRGLFAYHPEDPRVLFTTGGDWITRSTDGGATYTWAANGYNAVMTGFSFNFNYNTPDTVMFSFQDYNGAISRNGGHTWSYLGISGDRWGGMNYGGFALNSSVLVSGNSSGWTGQRHLTVSADGGATWRGMTDGHGNAIFYAGLDVSNGHPHRPEIAFASNFRTLDGGQTWADMGDVAGVFTFSGTGDDVTFYGTNLNKTAVIASTDNGATWTQRVQLPAGPVWDMAVNVSGPSVVAYVVADSRLFRCDASADSSSACSEVQTPVDQYGNRRHKSVAMDPRNSSRLFAANTKDIYASSTAVVASFDGGATWENLLVQEPLQDGELQGAHEATWLRVHPVTGELWAATGCFGIWAWSDRR